MSEKVPDLNERKGHAESFAELSVRGETAADKLAVHDVNVAAFGRDKEARLVDALRASDAFVPELSLVAERDNKIVGYILFTKIHMSEHPGHRCVAIGPVSVEPTAQKQGIGAALINSGIEKARALGYDSIILLGHPEYYPPVRISTRLSMGNNNAVQCA